MLLDNGCSRSQRRPSDKHGGPAGWLAGVGSWLVWLDAGCWYLLAWLRRMSVFHPELAERRGACSSEGVHPPACPPTAPHCRPICRNWQGCLAARATRVGGCRCAAGRVALCCAAPLSWRALLSWHGLCVHCPGRRYVTDPAVALVTHALGVQAGWSAAAGACSTCGRRAPAAAAGRRRSCACTRRWVGGWPPVGGWVDG